MAVFAALCAAFEPRAEDGSRKCISCHARLAASKTQNMSRHLGSKELWNEHRATVLDFDEVTIAAIEKEVGRTLQREGPVECDEDKAMRESFGSRSVPSAAGTRPTVYRWCKVCNPTGSLQGNSVTTSHLTTLEIAEHWKQHSVVSLQTWEHQAYALKHFPLKWQLELLLHRQKHAETHPEEKAPDAARPPAKDPAQVARDQVIMDLLGRNGLVKALEALERGELPGAPDDRDWQKDSPEYVTDRRLAELLAIMKLKPHVFTDFKEELHELVRGLMQRSGITRKPDGYEPNFKSAWWWRDRIAKAGLQSREEYLELVKCQPHTPYLYIFT
jgi:hypothetical protein